MWQSNVNACRHGNHAHTITTSDGRTAALCEQCHSDLLARLSDRSFVGLMIKSTLTSGEVAKIGFELLAGC